MAPELTVTKNHSEYFTNRILDLISKDSESLY